MVEKLQFFKFNRIPKSIHKLTIAHIELQCRLVDFQEGKLECEYFAQKLKNTIADIKAFEETAAPAGFSLLWDETDKKYGYINNYTGEVTQEYPSSFKADKVEKSKHKDISNLNSKDNNEKSKKPWKYTEDGSISGVLGGGTTNGSSSASKKVDKSTKNELVSQTDILKDTIHIEKVKEIKKKNEKVDRRLARLGIQMDEPKSEDKIDSKPAEKEDESKENEKEKESDGNMEISSESETDTKKPKKKKRKKDKSKGRKTDLNMIGNWKKRQEDEQASLWNQLGIN